MIIFDQLRISDDGGMFYIDVHVNQADYFDDIYIDYVVIKTSGQVSEADPLSSGDEYVYKYTVSDDTTKELHLAIQPSEFNEYFNSSAFSSDLFFVYVVCKGTVGACTPCRLDELTTLGVTFDTGLLYQKAMGFTRELADACSIPDGFIDFILNFNAFKAAVETEHYIPAINFYKQMFDMAGGTTSSTKICGCHG